MKCEKIEELLSPYLEDELSVEEKAAVDNHLKVCPNCSSLLSFMDESKESLSDFPELDVSQGLLNRLYALPREKKKFKFSLDFLVRPSLQPVFAAASILLMLISLYAFNPNKSLIDKSIDRQLHLGYSKVEKLYAKAGHFKDNLIAVKDNFLDSLKQKKTKLFGNED